MTFAIHLFFDFYAYKRELTMGGGLISFAGICLFLIGTTMLSSILVHISNIQLRLQTTNEENLKLLNGMHEGILIINESSIVFSNKPALKLFKSKEQPDKSKFLSQKKFLQLRFLNQKLRSAHTLFELSQ